MASTNDDTFSKYKLYSGVAIGGVLLAAMLDSCSGGSGDELVVDAAKQAAPVTQTAEQNLKPVEKLVVVDKNAPVAPARSGEAVYQAACLACHASGLLDAPKLEAGAWDTRIAKGLDGLTLSAINGLNAMPARGGNPAITDEEIKNAVSYMLATSGYDGAGEAETQAAAPVSPEAPKAPAAPVTPTEPVAPQAPVQTAASDSGNNTVSTQKYITDGSLGKQVYHNTCFACHDVGIAGAPVMGDTAEWQQRAAAGIDALYNSALNGKGLKPAKGGHTALSVEQINAAVDYILDSSGVNAAVAAPAEKTAESAQVAEPAVQTEAAAAPDAAPPAEPTQQAAAPATHAIQSSLDGEKIYRGICFSCHDNGIAGAPKLGDKAVWAPRIASGMDVMYTSSINGKGIMPVKGGNPALSDDEIKAAVDWMVQQSQ